MGARTRGRVRCRQRRVPREDPSPRPLVRSGSIIHGARLCMQYACTDMTVLLATDASAEENRTWLAALSDALPNEVFVTVRNAAIDPTIDIAMVANPPPASLAGLPALRLIQSLWAGVDALLEDATLPSDVPIARMVDPAMNNAMAQTALWAVIGSAPRFLRLCAQDQREHRWGTHVQRRADEVGVAVLGLGQMGRLRGAFTPLNEGTS